MTTSTWCNSCGAAWRPGAAFCSTCGMPPGAQPQPSPRAFTRRRTITVASVARALVALVAVGAVITWCTQRSSGGYAAKTADIVNATTERLNKLDAQSATDQQQCESGSLSACDRVVAMLSTAADEAAATRAQLQVLTPPAEAQQWHSDYLAFLRDSENTFRGAVAAWNSGNLSQFESSATEFDRLSKREDELISYFNSHLR